MTQGRIFPFCVLLQAAIFSLMAYDYYTPQQTVWSATGSIVGYIKNNVGLVWATIKYYLPYMAAAILCLIGHDILNKSPDTVLIAKAFLVIGFLLKAFIWPFLGITWHRIALEGPDDFSYANPLKPKKSELWFVLYGALLYICVGLLLPLGVASSAFGLGFLGAGGQFIVMMTLLFFILMFFVRASLMFPAIAVESDLSIKDVYAQSKGYFGKILFTLMLSVLGAALLLAIVVIPLNLIVSFLSGILFSADVSIWIAVFMNVVTTLAGQIVGLIATTLVLSNFYAEATGS